MSIGGGSHDATRYATARPWRRMTLGNGELGTGEDVRVHALVTAAKAGDHDALSELYALYAGRVRVHVLRILRDEHEAEDITQQVFAKLLTQLDRFEPGAVPFGAWIMRVAHNAAIDHLRRSRAVPCEDVQDPRDRADDAGVQCRSSLREALATLPADQRDVLVLRHLVGLSPTEIAVRLGRTVRSVHGLHYRGRAAACVALHDLGAAPATATPAVASWRWAEDAELELSA